MKETFALLLIIFLLLSVIFFLKQKTNSEKYKKYTSNDIKNLISNKDIFIIDTREGKFSNLGYVKNSIILPLVQDYDKWFPALIGNDSNIVLICDNNNYQESLETTKKLGENVILGYAIYDEIVEDKILDIQVAQYNENTKASLEKLVKDGKYILDIREQSEKEETGVVNEAHFIPLSTFRTNFESVPKSEDIHIFCKGGGRSLSAMSYLKREGYTNDIYVMKGGITQTIKEGYPLVEK